MPRPNKNADDIFNRVLNSKGPASGTNVPLDDQPVRGMPGAMGAEPSMEELPEQADMDPGAVSYQDAGYQDPGAGYGDLQQEPSYASQGGMNKHDAYDERPAQGRGRYTPESETQAAGLGAVRPAENNTSDIPAPDGWPGDLPGPEPLSGTAKKDAEPLEELAGAGERVDTVLLICCCLRWWGPGSSAAMRWCDLAHMF